MLNIYINTWGNYNTNGCDGGEWIILPHEERELDILLDRIAENMGDEDPEWFINDYEWTGDVSVREIDEHENIFELNEYIQKLDSLDDYEQQILMAAIDVFGYDAVDIDNLEEFTLLEDIEDDYDLGYYWVNDSGCYDLGKMGNLANYIDYEAFGRDIRFESDGGFSLYGWIERC